jgi:hypothetical protein
VSKFTADIPKVKKCSAESLQHKKESASAIATEARVDGQLLGDEGASEETRESIKEKQEIKSATSVIEAKTNRMKAELEAKEVQERYRTEILGAPAAPVDPMAQMTAMATAMSQMVASLVTAVRAGGGDGNAAAVNSEIERLKEENNALRTQQTIQAAVLPLTQRIEELQKTVTASAAGGTNELTEIIRGGFGELKGFRENFPKDLKEIVKDPEIKLALQQLKPKPPLNEKQREILDLSKNALRESARAELSPESKAEVGQLLAGVTPNAN